MKTDRGDFRSIYTVLVHSPEFRQLSPAAQLSWFHLKLLLGPSGLDVLLQPEATLHETTGMPLDVVDAALRELAGYPPDTLRDGIPGASKRGPNPKPFLVREGWLLWLRNALQFEPSRNLENANHRKSVERHIAALPKLRIVNDFARYYNLKCPFDDVGHEASHPDTMPEGIGNGIGYGMGYGITHPITDHGRRKTEDVRRKTEDGAARARTRGDVVPHEPPTTHDVDPDCMCWTNEPCPVPGHDVDPQSTPVRPSSAPSGTDDVDDAPEPDRFSRWMHNEEERLGPLPPITRLALVGLYGPNGTDERIWGDVDEDDRPNLLATAMLRWQSEARVGFNARLFRKILQAVITDGDDPPTNSNGHHRDDDPAPLTDHQHKLYLEIREALEECGMDPEQAAAEAMTQAREATVA